MCVLNFNWFGAHWSRLCQARPKWWHLLSTQVVSQAALEHLGGEEVIHHADDRGALGVRDTIEDLVDLVRVTDCDRNRMRRLKRIQPEHILQLVYDKLL